MFGGIMEMSVLPPDVFDVGFWAPGKLLFKSQSSGHFDDLPGITHGISRHGNDLLVVLRASLGISEKTL